MKTISIRQFASVKRIAQNVSPLVVKKNKIAADRKRTESAGMSVIVSCQYVFQKGRRLRIIPLSAWKWQGL